MSFGEEGKGEVSWEGLKFEIESIQAEGSFTEDQILFGIRRAAKGKARDSIRRLGYGTSV